MEIKTINGKLKCSVCAPKKIAEYELKLRDGGIGSRIYMCKECAKNLFETLKKLHVPKSIETMRPKRAKEN